MNAKILVIDDEEALCEILKFNLEKAGYDIDCAYSAEDALKKDLTQYQLMIVDIMMDSMNGFEFAKCVRKNAQTEYIPIIFCSALNSEESTVTGLNIGADDYITKPFIINEVLARVQAVLRRCQMTAKASENTAQYLADITYNSLRMNRNEKAVYLNGEQLPLTRTEYDIMHFFLTHPNKIYSRAELIENIWDNNVVVTMRTIDTNIARLRKKIGIYGQNIVTRLGFGYGFKEKT